MTFKTTHLRAMIVALLAVFIVPLPVRSDDAKPVEKADQADTAAAEAKPAEKVLRVRIAPVAPKAEAAEKVPAVDARQAIKNALAAIEIEGLAAPLVDVLQQKLDLNVNEAQLQQFIPQFTEQYRPILLRELNFIRQSCDLPVAQRPKVKAAGEAALKKAARGMAELQVNQIPGRSSRPIDPSKLIRDELMQALRESLTAEAMEKFADAVEKRSAIRKRASILCAVARLDSALCLTIEQRDQISASISAAWQDRWENWLMLNIYGDQYFPMVPDAQVVKFLNADQKVVWSGLQKVEFGFWNGGEQAAVEDGWWGDKPAKVVKPAGGVGFF